MTDALLEAITVSKRYGGFESLSEVSIRATAGHITCLLGDNGAGKSTLIKILSGVHRQDRGELRMRGETVAFTSPKDALKRGVATVYQDLAMVPLLPVVRDFFLGNEPRRGFGPARRVNWKAAEQVTVQELERVGITLRDPRQTVGTLSGGQRQCVAIARAMHFGATVLILDEPTAALGVKESGLVLSHIHRVKERGVGIILVTHNASHAHIVGDEFVLLSHGREQARFSRGDLSREELQGQMAGAAEMDEIAQAITATPAGVVVGAAIPGVATTDLDFS